jgi:hypothetical protein
VARPRENFIFSGFGLIFCEISVKAIGEYIFKAGFGEFQHGGKMRV